MKIQEQLEKDFHNAIKRLKPHVSLKWLQKVEARMASHIEELNSIEEGDAERKEKKALYTRVLPQQYFEQIFMKNND